MSGARLVIATGNQHKVEEIKQILQSTVANFDPSAVLTLADFSADSPVEDGVTFAANALIKARDLARQTGLPALADDSGLCVDVLGGSPGVFSARWAGHHGDDKANMNLLLAQLADVAPPLRSARFVCAAALALPDGSAEVREGSVEGFLTRHPHGDEGFGYDPIFRPTGWDVTTAEVSAEEKNKVSHRARALAELSPTLEKIFANETSPW